MDFYTAPSLEEQLTKPQEGVWLQVGCGGIQMLGKGQSRGRRAVSKTAEYTSRYTGRHVSRHERRPEGRP